MDHADDLVFSRALANECVASTLISLHKEAKVEKERLDAAAKYRHWRHIFYMAFSILAGSKIASATEKFAQASAKIQGVERGRPLAALWRKIWLQGRRRASVIRRLFWSWLKQSLAWIWRISSLLWAALKTKNSAPIDDSEV